MQYPKTLRYTTDHEWLDDNGRVGITDYAQDALGDVVFVDLPGLGSIVKAGDAVGVIESVKSVSDLYSPGSGRIVAVNQALQDHPELINQDAYGEGWIFQMEDVQADNLLSAEAYQQHVEANS